MAGNPQPMKRLAETPGELQKYYVKGEAAPIGANPEPVRDDIEITYQGFICSSCSFSKSLGLRPDRGSVTLAKSEPGILDFVVAAGDVSGWTDLATAGPRTGLPEEKEAGKPIKGKGFAIAGALVLKSPYGSIKLGPIFVDKDGFMENQISEDRNEKRGHPAPYGPPVGPGEVPPEPSDSAVTFPLVDERIFWDKRGVVTGRYNVQAQIQAFSIEYNKQRYEIGTTRPFEDRPWNLLELIQICVANLPPREFTVDGGRIYDPQPRKVRFWPQLIESECPTNVKWEGINARQALQKLLNDYGLHLNLRYDGDVEIFYVDMPGQFDPETELADLLGDVYHGKAYSFKPPSVIVVGEPMIEEMMVTDWTPVVTWDGSSDKWPEGAIIPLEVAMKEWGFDWDDVTDSVVNWFDGKDGKSFANMIGPYGPKRRQILKAQCLQWFQAKRYEKYVPIMRHRVKRVKGVFQDTPYEIFASFFKGKKEKDPKKGLWVNLVWENAFDLLSSVDQKELVLKFKQPMCVLLTDPAKVKDDDLKKLAAEVEQLTDKELAAVTDLQKLIAGLTGENLEEKKKAMEEIRKHAAILLDDNTKVNIHQAKIRKPQIAFTFMYRAKNKGDVYLNAQMIKALTAGQKLIIRPFQVAQYSDRYTYFVAGEAASTPEVIPADIQYYRGRDWTNKRECDDQARSLIQKRYAPPNFRELKDVTVAGFHPIPNSGKVTSASWESDGETATTRVKYGDFLHGIDRRPGIDWKEERTGPVTRMAGWFGDRGAVLLEDEG